MYSAIVVGGVRTSFISECLRLEPGIVLVVDRVDGHVSLSVDGVIFPHRTGLVDVCELLQSRRLS